jgi:hypothetical protein
LNDISKPEEETSFWSWPSFWQSGNAFYSDNDSHLSDIYSEIQKLKKTFEVIRDDHDQVSEDIKSTIISKLAELSKKEYSFC